MRALFHAQSPRFSQALSSLFGLPAAHRLTRFFCGKSQGGCSVPPACCSRLPNLSPPKIKKSRPSRRMFGIFGGGRWIRTTEVTDNRFTVCPLWPLGNSPIFTCALKRKLGAGRRTRTPDLLITNQLLYQLSYTSISATEWILADAAPFVKPKFFIFREEGLLHFKICSPAEKRRPYGRPCGRCSLCGCELLRGERGWYLNGQSVCADCFPAFARAELAPCETVFGMEGEA